MTATTYLADKFIDEMTSKAAFTSPTTVYIGLSSTTPTVGGSATEPSGSGYARQATTATTWNSAASSATSNAVAITFSAATADWVSGSTLTYAVAYDASTGGNLLWYNALTTAKAVLNGDTASIAIGALTVSIT